MVNPDDDPLVLTARLRHRRGRVVLYSGRNDDGLGQRSFVGCEPIATLEAWGARLLLRDANGEIVRAWRGDPLVALEEFAATHGVTLDGPIGDSTLPKLIGYLAYDAARAAQRRGPGPSDGDDVPDLWFGAYDALACFAPDSSWAVSGTRAGCARLKAYLAVGVATPGRAPRLSELRGPDDDLAAHAARIASTKAYLAAGDAYQVNVARRLVAEVMHPGDALAVLVALVSVSPAPYAALIEADGVTIISGSPERFLGRVGRRIETRPIKGTRPRAIDSDLDAAQRNELLSASKDAAEHLMIVDLERNDLGQIAEVGSVAVDSFAYVVSLPHVHHLVSRVSASVKGEVGLAQLLHATFPGGSITGAPKRRAMQIIDELEPTRRGPYCGAIGSIGTGGELELAIAIRIAVIANDQLRVHVGGGIVADSDADAEIAETEDKARGWRQALVRLARL